MAKRLDHTEEGHPLPSAPTGFVTRMITCLPCGERVPLDGIEREKLRAWILAHTEHFNSDEPWRHPKEWRR